jgi:hypothetical protein
MPEWLGHVTRKGQATVTKNLLNRKPEDEGKVRRFQMRWLEEAENNL